MEVLFHNKTHQHFCNASRPSYNFMYESYLNSADKAERGPPPEISFACYIAVLMAGIRGTGYQDALPNASKQGGRAAGGGDETGVLARIISLQQRRCPPPRGKKTLNTRTTAEMKWFLGEGEAIQQETMEPAIATRHAENAEHIPQHRIS